MENNILTVHVNPHKVMTWEGLGSSIISFAVPRNAGFLQGFRVGRAHVSAPNGQHWRRRNHFYTISTNAHECNRRVIRFEHSKTQICNFRNYKTEWHIFTRKPWPQKHHWKKRKRNLWRHHYNSRKESFSGGIVPPKHKNSRGADLETRKRFHTTNHGCVRYGSARG
ncbi:uncharacterized protein TM35_000093030 [Trypanosoma theileri]|uniref:Uncharacterized protein n=1 Tax=Trypanosoma theileri TaxID=67003 RepID=A0A1X0P0K8_9TRYP|nr:uncharacterized protein TM35_000093030 [Trypanosoma theileri]ORC90253.1 hypothetical protein TM35_000093030 [Trypanosoma theileri]